MKSELNTAKYILVIVLRRYLSEKEYKAFMDDLLKHDRITDSKFMLEMKKHFDINRWKNTPLISQDAWLHHYFTYEFKGRVTLHGLLRQYYHVAFVDDDNGFFKHAPEISKFRARLPRGVKFIPHEEPQPDAGNYLHSPMLEPKVRKSEEHN